MEEQEPDTMAEGSLVADASTEPSTAQAKIDEEAPVESSTIPQVEVAEEVQTEPSTATHMEIDEEVQAESSTAAQAEVAEEVQTEPSPATRVEIDAGAEQDTPTADQMEVDVEVQAESSTAAQVAVNADAQMEDLPEEEMDTALAGQTVDSLLAEMQESPPAKQTIIAAAEQVKATTPAPSEFKLRLAPPPVDRSEYKDLTDSNVVDSILSERNIHGETVYTVEFQDGHTEDVPLAKLLELENGPEVLSRANFQSDGSESVESSDPPAKKPTGPKSKRKTSSRRADIGSSSSEDVITLTPRPAISRDGRRTRGRNVRFSALQQTHRTSSSSIISVNDSSDESQEEPARRRSSRKTRARVSFVEEPHPLGGRTRRSQRKRNEDSESADPDDAAEEEEETSSDVPMLQSDLTPKRRSRKRKRSSAGKPSNHVEMEGLKFERSRRKPEATRQSNRSTRNQGMMKEIGEDQLSRSDSDTPARKPIVAGAREAFQHIPAGNAFAVRHCQQCETCGGVGGGPRGQLVYCQGCSLAYHRTCLGPRSSREHLVTKVGHGDCVLQCRRCISHSTRRDPSTPNQGWCQTCRKIGSACKPFRERKTPLQETKEREDNNGEDPVYPVNRALLFNPEVPLFRCMGCWRAWHYHHLLPKSDNSLIADESQQAIAEARFREYTRDWRCQECLANTEKVSGIVAWRPIDSESYNPGQTSGDVGEDYKEYLVKPDKRSYLRAHWMPGAWVWGVTNASMRVAFSRRSTPEKTLMAMTTEDAVPEGFVSIDIVLDVRFTSKVNVSTEDVDRARIREVSEAFVKYKGLGYEDVVWEKPPNPDEGERWNQFVTAYDDWVKGRHIRCPKPGPLKLRIEKARATPFAELEKKKQPDTLKGGELMKYQIEGLNWLYFHWHQQLNGILGDEMGLGKTIQIIGLLATLIQEHNCFPFLVVVPNSTCPNWRREIRRWAPSLRVVTFYGSETARDLALRHELLPEGGGRDLRAHVVVTSYDTATLQSCQSFFRSIAWQGLIVDEGQRLKNDKGLLYEKLSALKIPFRVLLTGTPLQNNARELFNLLQFLDDSFDASALELEYETLTKENIPVLHNMIRPLFLRRLKAQVLTFLPAMAQIIVPVTMSVIQKKLYMSILAKNPELLRKIFGGNRELKSTEKTNLNNIMMQLRKCLAHPFIYNSEIEEFTEVPAESYRNMVDASSKMQLLEVLLPKLRERGHRVLIFSQFLNMLTCMEDFLEGLQLPYQRLDGNLQALEKQKRIDEFNAEGSELFAFLLSTRAGGVGINLATADTVIILDPDFNPHQDIQALSRAHRIGQKRKVLCFQLMTQDSVEEKIVQIGRKKMALDHVLIGRMDAEEDEVQDLESILKHGAAALVSENPTEIKYDEASVEKLLNRTQIEESSAGQDETAESQFSYARVWANDAASMMDSLNSSDDDDEGAAPDPSVWEKILQERERVAAEAAARRQQVLGRGKRARNTINYVSGDDPAVEKTSPLKSAPKQKNDDSDTDFMEEGNKSESDESQGFEPGSSREQARTELNELDRQKRAANVTPANVTPANVTSSIVPGTRAAPSNPIRTPGTQSSAPTYNGIRFDPATAPAAPPQQQQRKPSEYPPLFRRANVVWQMDRPPDVNEICAACRSMHEIGHCPLKLAGAELCNLCGLAHFGHQRSCPHIRSETQVREMIATLNQSPESGRLVQMAKKYLAGVKGSIIQEKRRRADRQGPHAQYSKNLSAASIPNIINVDGASASSTPYPGYTPASSMRYNLPPPSGQTAYPGYIQATAQGPLPNYNTPPAQPGAHSGYRPAQQ